MSRRLSILLLASALGACAVGPGGPSGAGSLPAAQPSPPPAADVSPQPPPTLLQPGPCQHLLWPLADGAAWHYRLTRPDGSAQEVHLTAALSGSGATLTLDLGAGPLDNPLRCEADGLYGALGGLVGHPDLGAGLVLSDPDRPFLPSADRLLPLGTPTSWDAQYDAGGLLSLPLESGATQLSVTGGEVVLYATAGPLESIVTPAGAFRALPVEQSVLFNLQVSDDQGQSGGLFGDAQARLYWAEGVGLVRQEFEGGMLSGGPAGGPVVLEAGVTLDLLDYQAAVPAG